MYLFVVLKYLWKRRIYNLSVLGSGIFLLANTSASSFMDTVPGGRVRSADPKFHCAPLVRPQSNSGTQTNSHFFHLKSFYYLLRQICGYFFELYICHAVDIVFHLVSGK
jgi:hypothetical protein